jgi:NAD(P)-dependent dehydrogenase (short-subunit alcohol dehydrogenase family)
MNLHGRVALVTGGGVRLGRAIVRELAAAGARVGIHYHASAEGARSVAAEIRAAGGQAEPFELDLGRIAELPGLVERVVAAFGRLDILINNAAIFPRTPFDEVTEADWDGVMALNLKAPFFLSQAAARVMRAQGAGKIVNLADIAAERPWPGYLPYCLSKAGVVAMTRGLARALAPAIQVNAVAPGTVLFPEAMSQEERERLLRQVPLQREGSAADVARTVRFLIEGSDYITGVVLPVDGGRSVVG